MTLTLQKQCKHFVTRCYLQLWWTDGVLGFRKYQVSHKHISTMQVDLSHQESLLLHFCFTEQGLKVPLFFVSAIQWIGGYPEAKTTIVNGLWLCLPSCLVTVGPPYFCMFLHAMITYIWLFYFFSDWTMVFGPQRLSRFDWTEIPRYLPTKTLHLTY